MIGRVLDELDRLGLADNTVVLFTSDNGHFVGEHGLAGKWLMHEPSLRVPGFIHDPRRPGGKSSGRMVITTDFSATMLALGADEIHMGPLAFLTAVDTFITHDLSPVDKDNDLVRIGTNELERVLKLWHHEAKRAGGNCVAAAE